MLSQRRDSARSAHYEAVSIADEDEDEPTSDNRGDDEAAALISGTVRSTELEEEEASGSHPLQTSRAPPPSILVRVMAPPKFLKPAELRLAARATVEELRAVLMDFLEVPSEGKRLRVISQGKLLSEPSKTLEEHGIRERHRPS